MVRVWPDNRVAVVVFLNMQTQWLYAGMGGVKTGLNYASLREVWRGCSIRKRDRAEVFAHLRIMEVACINAANADESKDPK